jgi:hypothetical protein
MCRFAQPAKHFPRVREIGNLIEYERRKVGLTFQLALPFAGRPESGLETNLNHNKTTTMEGNIMKKSILILACAAIAPFAFAQTSTTTTEATTTKTNPLTSSSETTTTTTSTDGTVTTFDAGKTIVVRKVGVTDPISYVLGKTVRYVNKAGAEIQASMVKPGARVHVYYDGTGETRVVNRVVVDE